MMNMIGIKLKGAINGEPNDETEADTPKPGELPAGGSTIDTYSTMIEDLNSPQTRKAKRPSILGSLSPPATSTKEPVPSLDTFLQNNMDDDDDDDEINSPPGSPRESIQKNTLQPEENEIRPSQLSMEIEITKDGILWWEPSPEDEHLEKKTEIIPVPPSVLLSEGRESKISNRTGGEEPTKSGKFSRITIGLSKRLGMGSTKPKVEPKATKEKEDKKEEPKVEPKATKEKEDKKEEPKVEPKAAPLPPVPQRMSSARPSEVEKEVIPRTSVEPTTANIQAPLPVTTPKTEASNHFLKADNKAETDIKRLSVASGHSVPSRKSEKKESVLTVNNGQIPSQIRKSDVLTVNSGQIPSQSRKSAVLTVNNGQIPSQSRKSAVLTVNNGQIPSQSRKSDVLTVNNGQIPSQSRKSGMTSVMGTFTFGFSKEKACKKENCVAACNELARLKIELLRANVVNEKYESVHKEIREKREKKKKETAGYKRNIKELFKQVDRLNRENKRLRGKLERHEISPRETMQVNAEDEEDSLEEEEDLLLEAEETMYMNTMCESQCDDDDEDMSPFHSHEESDGTGTDKEEQDGFQSSFIPLFKTSQEDDERIEPDFYLDDGNANQAVRDTIPKFSYGSGATETSHSDNSPFNPYASGRRKKNRQQSIEKEGNDNTEQVVPPEKINPVIRASMADLSGNPVTLPSPDAFSRLSNPTSQRLSVNPQEPGGRQSDISVRFSLREADRRSSISSSDSLYRRPLKGLEAKVREKMKEDDGSNIAFRKRSSLQDQIADQL